MILKLLLWAGVDRKVGAASHIIFLQTCKYVNVFIFLAHILSVLEKKPVYTLYPWRYCKTERKGLYDKSCQQSVVLWVERVPVRGPCVFRAGKMQIYASLKHDFIVLMRREESVAHFAPESNVLCSLGTNGWWSCGTLNWEKRICLPKDAASCKKSSSERQPH